MMTKHGEHVSRGNRSSDRTKVCVFCRTESNEKRQDPGLRVPGISNREHGNNHLCDHRISAKSAYISFPVDLASGATTDFP